MGDDTSPNPAFDPEEHERRRTESLERSARNIEEFRARSLGGRSPAEPAEPAGSQTPATPPQADEDERIRLRDLREAQMDLENGQYDVAVDGIVNNLDLDDAWKEDLLDRLVREAPTEEIRAALLARIERVWVRRGNWALPTNLFDLIWDGMFGPHTPSRQRQQQRWRQADLSRSGQTLLNKLNEIEARLPGAGAAEERQREVVEAIRQAVEPFVGAGSLPLSKKNQEAVQKMVAAALVGAVGGIRLGAKGALTGGVAGVLTTLAAELAASEEAKLLDEGGGTTHAPAHGNHVGRRMHWAPEGGQAWWQNFLGTGRSIYEILDAVGIGSSAAVGAVALSKWLLLRTTNHLIDNRPPPPPGGSPPPGGPPGGGGPPDDGGSAPAPPPTVSSERPLGPTWPEREENASEKMMRMMREFRATQGKKKGSTPKAPPQPGKRKRGRPLGSLDTVKRKTPVRKKKKSKEEEEEEEEERRQRRTRGGLKSKFMESVEALLH